MMNMSPFVKKAIAIFMAGLFIVGAGMSFIGIIM